ncbi:MAG TPA: porin, partial [Tepidisphaeraceae bacterium]|nr:porin [Tepidisphaeraceae bacterium]
APAASPASPAPADEPSYDDLRRQLGQLQARLDAVERKADSADVARTVDQLVRDAEQRSKLLQTTGDVQAGHDKGFFIRSSDGNFVLRPGVQFQFRNITNVNTGDDAEGEDSIENGFEVRRLRFRFDGNLFTPKLTYLFQWDTSRTTGGLSLLDAWGQYQFADNWAVRIGQFKESVFHEKDVSGFQQLAVERSLADALLGGSLTDRVQGISVIYGGNDRTPARVEVAFHDGANSKNTNWRDTDTGDFGFGGRAEWKLAGKWADYKDFTARQTKQDLFVIGAGADWTQEGGGDQILTTVDAQYKTPTGWSLYGALHGAQLRDDEDDNFSWGALGQVGYAINQRWEPFARYDIVSIDDAADGQDTYNEFTAGVNYYLGDNGAAGHRAKLSVDVVFLPDGAPSDQTGLGVLAGEEAQFVLRTQFQLLL